MGLESDGLFKRVAILVVETALTGSEDNGGNQGSKSSSHVDNTRSSKVDNSDSTEGIVSSIRAEGSKETVSRPDRMDDNGVDKSGEEEGVAKVGGHLTAFGDSSSHNSGGSGSESELEEETCVVGVFAESKVAVSNKGLRSGVISAVSESKTNTVETNGTTAGIQKILQQDVLDVLLADRSCAQHGETSLHHEDEGSLLTLTNVKKNIVSKIFKMYPDLMRTIRCPASVPISGSEYICTYV